MSLWKEGKNFISLGVNQIKYQKDILKLKLKIYGFHKKIENDYLNLGQYLYEFMQEGEKDILEKKEIVGFVEDINRQKEGIAELEKEIDRINREFNPQ